MKVQVEKGGLIDIPSMLGPETEQEFVLLGDEEFVRGLDWGLPRYGHPEGRIYLHVLEVLSNIDLLGLPDELRWKLRIIALLHDAFKHRERKGTDRNGSHHGHLARVYAEKRFSGLDDILDLIEWHDEAYFAWRKVFLQGKPDEGLKRLERLERIMGMRMEWYYYFFWCDTRTGDKNPAPLIWFEKKLSDRIPAIAHPKGTMAFAMPELDKRLSG